MKNIITLPGVKNARELGGYGAGGSTVRTGALIRSGALDRAAPEAADILRDKYRLQAIVDFRMQVKRAAAPDVEIDGARNIGAPVIEMEDYAAMAGSPDMLKLYKANAADKRAVFEMAYEYGMLGPQIYLSFLFGERGKRAYREFFRVLLDSDPDKGAVLWHCDDGKDRAGLAAALLLSALGADRATIMEDYLLTNDFSGMYDGQARYSPMCNEDGGVVDDLTAEDVANGKVAYILGWGQFLDIDDFPSPLAEQTVSYVGDAGYATMYDNTTGYVLNGDVEAYVATSNGKWLSLTEIENVPAETPVILKGTYYNKFAYDVPAINIANDLKGTDAETEADGTMYVLAKVEDQIGFYKATGTIAAGKAYFQSASGVKAFYFDGEEATGINEVNGQGSMANGQSIYNLAGQRVSKIQNGINIVNGKKVLF